MDWVGLGDSALSGVVDNTLGLLGNFANGAIQNYFWNKQYDKTRADFLSDRQHQEEYNSPVNQMKLLAEAGLNPNLVYGKLGGMGASGTSTAQQQQAKGVSPSSNTGNIANIMAAQAHRKQVQLQEDAISAKAELDRAQAHYYNSMSPLWQSEIAQKIEHSKVEIQKIYQDISVGKSQEQLNYAREKESIANSILSEAQTLVQKGIVTQQEFQNREIIARTCMYTQQANLFSEQSWLVQMEADLKEFQNDVNSAIRAAGGIDKIADSQLETIAHELKILATKAKVEGNEINAWVHSIAPLVFNSGVSSKVLGRLIKFMVSKS